MRHATLGGGKRLRPFLLLRSAGLFGARDGRGVARRGSGRDGALLLAGARRPAGDGRRRRPPRPAGDATSPTTRRRRSWPAMRFSRSPSKCSPTPRTHADPAVRSELVLACARAAGPHGMVGGQMVDLASGHGRLALDEVAAMQRLKTGALFRLSCDAGALLGGAGDADPRGSGRRTPRRSASPSRSPTTCSTPTTRPRRTAAGRRSSPCSAPTAPAPGPKSSPARRSRRCRRSTRAQYPLRAAAGFAVSRRR